MMQPMVVDFHAHVLPQLDDGSKSVEQSLEMLRQLAAQGVTHVVATPHFYPQQDSPDSFLTKRQQSLALLQKEMEKDSQLPELLVGAEVYYYPGISDSEALSDLTIGHTSCILIEMPMCTWTEQMYLELAGIYEKHGLIPVIAHIDRYISPLRARRVMDRLEELPVYVQANAESFTTRSTRRMMLRLLRRGQIHLLGTDCHDLADRAPKISEAVQIILRHLGPDAIGHIQYFEQNLLKVR